MQTLDKSSRQIAHRAITRIEDDEAYTDIVLSHVLAQTTLETREKAFISELVRGVVRWKKRLDFIVNRLLSGKRNKLPTAIRYNLWLALYQIIFTNVPPHAAVNEAVKLSRDLNLHGFSGLVNGVLRNYLRQPEQIRYANPQENPTQFLAVYYSHPEWMVKRWIHQFGFEAAEKICIANNQAPALSIRVNAMQISVEHLEKLLSENELDYERGRFPGYYTIKHIDHQVLAKFSIDGLLTVQDQSAAIPGILVNPQPGERILDMCAAPGGKSMHMAELSAQQATIISADSNAARCGLIQQANSRLSHNVQVIAANALWFPVKTADKVLLDVPCSGLGVLAKKPDMRWHRTLQEMRELNVLQQKLLQKAAQLVKPGGTLIYSTCTIDESENENIINSFLELNSDFYIDTIDHPAFESFITKKGFIRTWPYDDFMDGSFCGRLKRK